MHASKEIWQVAIQLVRRHATAALDVAREHAVAAVESAADGEVRAWVAVALAIEDLFKEAPADGERVH
jgi:hypothetical protein